VDATALLEELYGRVPPLAHEAVEGLDLDRLTRQVTPEANTVAWLVWHIARVQDGHIAELREAEDRWTTGGWAPRFGFQPGAADSGYGHSPEQVRALRPESAEVLLAYADAAFEQSAAFLRGLSPGDLDRIVDRRWDPPVTLGVRLVSIADDSLQHVGQANYVRGLLGV
jgi:uncharacterized damage-inducible protein DinB